MIQAQGSSQADSLNTRGGNATGPPPRMFVFERGWNAGVKTGSTRELCHMMAPGQDFYHRLGDGEVYVYQGTEKLCLACAYRRGLIAFEPKQLRDAVVPVVEDLEGIPLDVASL
jgi:hypothetical protein